MIFWVWFGVLVNIISLFTILISVYVFFTDLFRRWLFFGYKPTAILIILDKSKKKTILIKKNFEHGNENNFPWHFPQGGIYSADIVGSVSDIFNSVFGLGAQNYNFEKTIILGVKKVRQRKIYKKYHFGSISLYSSFRGKGYVGCVVYGDLQSIKKKMTLGYEVDTVKIVSFSQALKIIDPEKSALILKVSKMILE